LLRQITLAVVVVTISSTTTVRSQSPAPAAKRPLPDFDIRELELANGRSNEQRQATALVEKRRANLTSFVESSAQIQAGTRITPNTYGLPKLYLREGRALTAPSALQPAGIARGFLRAEPNIFSLDVAEIERLRLVLEDVSGNAKFLAFNQTLNGIDVFNGHIKFTMTRDGEIIQVATGDIVPGLSISTTPRLTPNDAVKAAFDTIGNPLSASLSRGGETSGKFVFANPAGTGNSPITAELSIFPMTASSARLAYRIFLEVDPKSWYEILIDANDGTLLFRHNLYVFSGQARVWPESPMKGARTLVTLPAGWLPANGTVTTGNNVDAYLDANGNDQPDTITDANMKDGRAFSATQVFDFQFGDGTVQLDPRQFRPAVITNLFYFVNTAHDYYYGIGFDEAAGNFQSNNFDRGGIGNDAVLAEAQFDPFTNNAAFAATPEGIAPKIRMGLFTRGTSSLIDDLDSDYDGMVILHEYGHGVSNRLVGAKTSTSCLDRVQSGALGEGWSDYFAISFFNDPVMAAYITQNAIRGVRRFSYEGYPLTYEDIGNGNFGYEVHDDGEIWAGTLWDLRKSLGAATTDRLVIDGLKSTPCNPSMTDARDAIISADQADNGGANRTTLWTIFARHGLGFSAVGVDGTLLTGTRYDAAYNLPPDLQTNPNPAITSNPLLLRPGLGDLYSYNVTALNPQDGVLNYVLSSGPANMNVAASSGIVTWTADFVSSRVKITVTDGKGGKVVHGYALPVLTTLVDSRPITIAAQINTIGFATIPVPAGTPVLQIKLRGGVGDADLFVRNPVGVFSASVRDGNVDTLSFANPGAGDWQVMVDAFNAYSGVSLTASLITATLLSTNVTLSGLGGDVTSETFYRIAVPDGTRALSISTSGGTGDVDMLLRKGSPAVCPLLAAIAECLFDQASAMDGNAESISLTNPAAGDWYLDLFGFADYTGVRLDITATLTSLTLTSIGAAATSTLGTSPPIAVGYATAGVNGTAPYGTAVFSLSQNGNIVSEAGVPASPPVQSARIFIEYRTGVTAGIGTIDTLTGLAFASGSASPASLTYTLRDRNGQIIATGHGSLPPNAHRARFVHQLQDLAPDFNLPADFSTAIQYGSLEISSNQAISVLGLRLTLNQRGEALLTSTSIADLSRPLTSSTLYFPQVADGGGYTTTVILSNTSGATETGTISISNDAGAPLNVRPVGGTTGPTFSYSIPAAGTFVFKTDGSPSFVRSGWVKVTPDNGSNAPIGAGVFSYSPAGILVTESGIPSSAATTRARLYVDTSNGHDTGLAISNPAGTPITVNLQAFQTDGSSAGNGPVAVNLAANGHLSAFVGQLISGLPLGFTGVADLTSSSPFVPLTLRSLANGRGDFLLTTFPAADLTQPAPTPIVFPQIADGGGYTTQFIFISADGAASVTVNFVDDNGAALSLGQAP
jgi:Fungalysin metallopeptidase (M36)/Bacterial pre-peptidase C-terminal domain/Fungalysin/Thermolysin Propeptide Motif